MVATREERALKLARRTADVVPVFTLPERTDAPSVRHSRTVVNGYVVNTYGSTARATPAGASAIVDIYPPGDSTHEQAHDLAVRFLRRRGPDYAPSGSRVIITLDQRGRQRHIDRIG